MPTDELLARLADVELPPAPDWRPYVIAAAALVVLALAATALLLLLRRRAVSRRRVPPPFDARQRVVELQQAYVRGEVTERDAAYRLATILRLGLGLSQLEESAPPAQVDREHWARILRRLAHARYTRQTRPPDSEDFAAVIDWLAARDQRGQAG
jgi:hypothetical protein